MSDDPDTELDTIIAALGGSRVNRTQGRTNSTGKRTKGPQQAQEPPLAIDEPPPGWLGDEDTVFDFRDELLAMDELARMRANGGK